MPEVGASKQYEYTHIKVVEQYGKGILDCMRAQKEPRPADFGDIDHGFDAIFGMTYRRWHSAESVDLGKLVLNAKMRILDSVNSALFPAESIAKHNQSVVSVADPEELAVVVPIEHGRELLEAKAAALGDVATAPDILYG